MDRENEGAWDDPYGSASICPIIDVHKTEWVTRMAYGLGMNAEEWQELRAQVDDSFWVMRIIGSFRYHVQVSVRDKKTQDTDLPTL